MRTAALRCVAHRSVSQRQPRGSAQWIACGCGCKARDLRFNVRSPDFAAILIRLFCGLIKGLAKRDMVVPDRDRSRVIRATLSGAHKLGVTMRIHQWEDCSLDMQLPAGAVRLAACPSARAPE